MASVEKDPRRNRTPYVVRWRDEAGKQRKRGFRRKIDAERFRAEVEHQLHNGTYVDYAAGSMTFAEFFETWSVRQVWSPGTETAMRLAARTVTFARVPLRQLRRSHVEAWVKSMQLRGLEPSTIRTRYNNVRSVLRGAVNDRLMGVDPSQGVKLPRTRRADAAMVLPTPGEVRALLDAADERFVAFIALCAFAGLRLGEAAALRVADIDFERRTLTVARQVQRAGAGRVEIRPPKYGSERTVFLADGLVEILTRHIELDGRTGWMFDGQNDLPPHQNTVGYWWRRARAAAGVPDVKLHDLRHFYASGLIAQGCDVVTVQRALGHASATVTLKTYAHLWPNAEDRTRAAAAALIAETLGPAVPKACPGSEG